MAVLEKQLSTSLKYNVIVNLLDGAFFGAGWGFGSFGTIIPLFVSRLTDSALLIGLIPAIHVMGWQFPQLFMAGSVARQRQYKPMVMWLTIHERIPYLGLAVVALLAGSLGKKAALVLIFILLVWQGVGAGLTANGWQSMLAKIIPSNVRGTFFGAQAALANVLISITSVAAGFLLTRVNDRFDFTLCFLIALGWMGLSMLFLGLTREPVDIQKTVPPRSPAPWKDWLGLLRQDRAFSAFLFVRLLSQFATMGFAFYIVYGLQRFAMNELTAGFLTAVLTITQTAANLLMGWLGDRLGHRPMLIAGSLAVTVSSLLAWQAQSLAWMYPAVILAALANVAYWTIGMAFTVEFGTEETRSTYIGLSNTLVAPFAFLAPLAGGLIAERVSYQATFLVSALVGLVAAALLFWLVSSPRPRPASQADTVRRAGNQEALPPG